eukprot:6212274-Pleurochrysis_carterae.AAC.3
MGHGMYLAKLWSEPYLLQSYTVSPSPQLPVRVYEATAADLNINADCQNVACLALDFNRMRAMAQLAHAGAAWLQQRTSASRNAHPLYA